MTKTDNINPTILANRQATIDLIIDITVSDYPNTKDLVQKLMDDLTSLFSGQWSGYESCQVGYHTLDHALDVTLATARMISGWNNLAENKPMPEHLFLSGIAAASFHDAGFMKDKGDDSGYGGKYTYTHVPRSMTIAEKYLAEQNWPAAAIPMASKAVSLTEFHERPVLTGLFQTEEEKAIACMVATADLVAQMADIDYIKRITNLFDEFEEAYDFEGRDKLKDRGVFIFNSAQEMIDGTIGFYENFVLPRLKDLGRMDKYLIAFFGEGRNLYFENITANLTAHLVGKAAQRRRLGEILEDLGVVDGKKIKQALGQQRNISPSRIDPLQLNNLLLQWVNQQLPHKGLGDILIEMKAITPSDLRKGLLSQFLPPSLADDLSGHEWRQLLEISLLLQHLHINPWLLGQVMEMVTEMLACEAGAIMLASPNRKGLVVMMPSGFNPNMKRGDMIPIDKGLEGWVFNHVKPAMVSDKQLEANIGDQSGSAMAVPLYLTGTCLGVVELFNKKDDIDFNEHDLKILILIAGMIGNTLELAITCSEKN
ncbi:MAG: GAF domain-containing protein [Desulfobulbaceae bacterium]|nr:GAF domain-containing protein [Desulfobulbaceae bacterium]